MARFGRLPRGLLVLSCVLKLLWCLGAFARPGIYVRVFHERACVQKKSAGIATDFDDNDRYE